MAFVGVEFLHEGVAGKSVMLQGEGTDIDEGDEFSPRCTTTLSSKMVWVAITSSISSG